MNETSVKIIKIEIRCRDDTAPKTVDTRSHCKVWLRACNNLPQPPPYISFLGGLRKIVACSQPYLQFLAQCHPFIFTLVESFEVEEIGKRSRLRSKHLLT